METAKLFMDGRSQAVRLPKQFRFEGQEVYIRQVGQAVVLLPYHAPWQTLFDSLDQFSADFLADGRQQPSPQERPELFPSTC